MRELQQEEYFYIPPGAIAQDHAIMTDRDECRHVTLALRKKPGDTVTFVDGEGWLYDGVIDRVDKKRIRIGSVIRRRDETEPRVRVTLAPALIKGVRLDTVVEKATELGVDEIRPMRTARTIVNPGASDSRQARWERIALSAMKQSLRSRLPVVWPVTAFHEVAQSAQAYDLALIAWEEERNRGLETITATDAPPQRVLLLIGPEGGFESDEIAAAHQAGIHPVSFGRRRFRADTASLVAVTLLMAALGELQPVDTRI